MFGLIGLIRQLWHCGNVPPMPADYDLDWPDEEEWCFDYYFWRWMPVSKVPEYDDDEYDDDAETNSEDDTLLEDKRCCEGGECHFPVELPKETQVCCGGACQMPVKDVT